MKVIPFNEAPHAPYELGQVPVAGWFAVEPTCEWTPKMQDELRRSLNDPSDTVYQAQLDAAGLAILADNFSLAATDGRGLPCSEQHKFEKAYGWVKSLRADGDSLVIYATYPLCRILQRHCARFSYLMQRWFF